jgi:protein-L-isoaspartate(D-aspartate) O-methyltransferase
MHHMHRVLPALILAIFFPLSLIAQVDEDFFETEIAENLVQNLENDGIELKGWIRDALQTIPRESFLPEYLQAFALQNRMLPIGNGRILLSPDTAVNILNQVEGSQNSLIIGQDSIYLAGLLGTYLDSITVIEYFDRETSLPVIEEMQQQDLVIVYGRGLESVRTDVRFDLIIVHAAVRNIPSRFLEQLNPGGVLICPLLGDFGNQILIRIELTEDYTFTVDSLGSCYFPELESLERIVP